MDGADFQVNTYTTEDQFNAAIDIDPRGGFVVVWHSYGSAGSDQWFGSIQGQRYASDGTVLGGEFQVNAYTPYQQEEPDVGIAPNGDFVVVWESIGSGGTDTSGKSVQGQRYIAVVLFTDGFESGDLTAWTPSVASPHP